MNNYIRIENGEAVGMPISEQQLKQDYPDININLLPPEFARFIKTFPPKLGPYEKNQTRLYEWENGIIRENWYSEQLSIEEKTAKQEQAKARWAQIGFPSWVFDESMCWFKPPIEKPNDGKIYRWDENMLNWVRLYND